MQIERITDRDRWNGFMEDNHGPVFDLWEWGRLCAEYGHEAIYLGAIDDGDLYGVLPLVAMRSRLFGSKLISMPFSEYGSVVLAGDAPPETTTHLLEETRELADDRGVDFVSLRGKPLENPAGFTRKRRFVTFEIPVDRDADEIWNSLDGSRRTHIRNGQDSDLEIIQATSVEDLRRYYDLYLDNMQKFGTPPHSFGFFRSLWEALGDVMRIDLAVHDDRLVNGQIVFNFGDYCYDWGGVSDHEYRDMQGGSALLWYSIERASNRGYSRYSLGRTREDTGVYTFKKSWGGKKVRLTDYHYFPNGTIDLPNPDDDTYDRAKDVWQKLPIRMTEYIGPPIRKKISL